jgi:CRISPR-associated protein Csm3
MANTPKLIGKYIITGEIKCETGLHIGGSKTALDIGGIDLNVIKTSAGMPFIPGSSLKGKLRSLLAKEEGSINPEQDSQTIKEIFGDAPSKNSEGEITRLIVRDSFLKNYSEIENKEGEFSELELDYTESKWENTIDRKSGTAGSPRQIERVPKGAIFTFEIVYNIYDDNNKDKHLEEIKKALNLLKDDYLGGSGSRGYGKISFNDLHFKEKTIENYKSGSDGLTGKFELK